MKDHVPRQDIVETRIVERQRVGIGLTQAYSEAARVSLSASEVEPRGGTVNRLDGKAMLGKQQRVPADAATEVEHLLCTTLLQHRHDRNNLRMRYEPVSAALRSCPALVPRLDRRRFRLRLPPSLGCAMAVIIAGKRRCVRRSGIAPS